MMEMKDFPPSAATTDNEETEEVTRGRADSHSSNRSSSDTDSWTILDAAGTTDDDKESTPLAEDVNTSSGEKEVEGGSGVEEMPQKPSKNICPCCHFD
jgi:hypothetical protein